MDAGGGGEAAVRSWRVVVVRPLVRSWGGRTRVVAVREHRNRCTELGRTDVGGGEATVRSWGVMVRPLYGAGEDGRG